MRKPEPWPRPFRKSHLGGCQRKGATSVMEPQIPIGSLSCCVVPPCCRPSQMLRRGFTAVFILPSWLPARYGWHVNYAPPELRPAPTNPNPDYDPDTDHSDADPHHQTQLKINPNSYTHHSSVSLHDAQAARGSCTRSSPVPAPPASHRQARRQRLTSAMRERRSSLTACRVRGSALKLESTSWATVVQQKFAGAVSLTRSAELRTFCET